MADLPLFPAGADDSVKGFALTPAPLVDLMVGKLFADREPAARDRLLDPGCGTGEFIAGVIRWCRAHHTALPSMLGIEQHSDRAQEARRRFHDVPQVEIRTGDYLTPSSERFEFIVGNPPYVAITGLSSAERVRYRRDFETATGRFDLYTLFFEQSLGQLAEGGRLVFVTPEKYLYVDSTASLRGLFTAFDVRELHFVAEDAFEGLVTYPLITTLDNRNASRRARVVLRDGTARDVRLGDNGDSWLPAVLGAKRNRDSLTLSDICSRISCGVATGADSVFVVPSAALPADLAQFAYDTVSGRQLAYGDVPSPTHKILVPYDRSGRLLLEREMGPLLTYLKEPSRRARLVARTCVARKPWYAFHETPPISDLARVKLLCKDIGAHPHFAVDRSGNIMPRHSTYFAVPTSPDIAAELCRYLNSAVAQRWLTANCQRAAKGFLRLQSAVLKRLPIPDDFADAKARSVPSTEAALQSA